ncbi:MAG TPA: amidohydrolase family protein [Candidatus Dormibacteraeota bacterium]|nr:amidohydrolase family protein [Candidatus Dormibacteraeota bacterium]
MRIDSHQHFWKFNAARDAWITEEMSVLRRDYLPEHLAQELKANKIGCSIAVQADQSEEETFFLLQLAERHPSIAGVVGWIDLCSTEAAERIEFFSKFEKLRGFRHIAQSEPDDRFLVRDDFLRGVACLRQFHFAYDILIYPKQLPAAVELVTRFPEQRFVIDHLAKPEIKTKNRSGWATLMRQIAENPNVYCKVSGLVTEAHWKNWKKEDFRPSLDVVFDAFGPDRLMFGSDWPVCLLAASYRQVMEIVEEYLQDFSADIQEKIFGGNAAKFYGLKMAQHGFAA